MKKTKTKKKQNKNPAPPPLECVQCDMGTVNNKKRMTEAKTRKKKGGIYRLYTTRRASSRARAKLSIIA